jgi:hypothetical protein
MSTRPLNKLSPAVNPASGARQGAARHGKARGARVLTLGALALIFSAARIGDVALGRHQGQSTARACISTVAACSTNWDMEVLKSKAEFRTFASGGLVGLVEYAEIEGVHRSTCFANNMR